MGNAVSWGGIGPYGALFCLETIIEYITGMALRYAPGVVLQIFL
jgi:hypothetical protein